MADKRSSHIRLARYKNALFSLLRNKMAFIGLFMLTLFILLALTAPYLTPYNPQGTVVSGDLDPPSWITLFTGDVGWSRNTAFSGPTASSFGNGVSMTVTSQGPTAATFHVASASSSGGKILLVEKLSYPYRGPPKGFIADAAITPSNANPSGLKFFAQVYVERVGVAKWCCFWNETMTSSIEYGPIVRFDSKSAQLVQNLGFGSLNLNPAELIFSKIADYTYTLEVDLPAAPFQADFSVRNFSFFLYGNTWGLLGTDDAGRDIFTQLAYGAQYSLAVGLLATFIGVGLGLVVGLMAGYLGKAVDEVLMRFTDMMLVIPGLPLLIVLVAVIGPSLFTIIVILGFLGWMGFARLVRSQVLSLRERPFIEAAKASGAGTGYITVKHIFPNIVGLTYVNLALSVPAAIVGEAALSFLGLGDDTVITWGKMLELSRETGSTTTLLWWWVVPPGVAIALISLSFILLGYAMDELFNPRLRKRR